MLSTTGVRWCLAQIAAASAAQCAKLTAQDSDAPRPSPADPAPMSLDCVLWIDDTAEARAAQEAHVRSAGYRELHRPAATNSAMGLFGGEPGFEKSYRVWVDPDRPQMKHIYNQTALAKNLRYARYGYFKRDMRILDIDKLVRHARLLPTPNRLLTDFLYQRVPLPDKSCAALLRYQRDQLLMMEEWNRTVSLYRAEEMFERMAVTNIPPVEVGVETHAEMIRCCALCKEWDKGWNIYLKRAREIEEESAQAEGDFVLDTNFFDAAMELCVQCERTQEGMDILEEVVKRHLRPRASMLDKAMVLAAIAVSQLTSGTSQAAATDGGDTNEDDKAPSRRPRQNVEQFGLDAWTLYDFYQLERSTATLESYLRMCSTFNKPTLALEALVFADASQVRLSLSCYSWAIFALRDVPAFGDFVMDTIGQLAPRGLTPDYVLFTVAFMYCAIHRDGELALALYQQHMVHYDINPTPELVLLLLQACASCDEPRVEMLSCGDAVIERLESVGSAVDCISDIYDQYMELAAHLGAVGSAFSKVKKLVSFGKPLTTRQLNSLLLANANAAAPNGGLSVTVEVAEVFRLLRVVANDDTIHCLELCAQSFGTTPLLDSWRESLEADRARRAEHTLGTDADIPVRCDPPNAIRALRVDWHIRPRDMVLKRHGQTRHQQRSDEVGSMLGSVTPFGRAPGERLV